MTNFTIRKMLTTDIDAVLAVEAAAFRTPWPRTAFEEELSGNALAVYLVLLDETADAKIIGYAGMWKIIDEAHITNIAIAPDYQGRGWGNVLLRGLIKEARENGVSSMTLEVREKNAAAIKLYKKFDFQEEGRRRGYYTDTKEDALIMWKNGL